MKLSVLDQAPIPEGKTFADTLRSSVELAVAVERLGYSRYWAAEHHAMTALASPAPEILLAQVAAATRHIRIGSGGIMLPHYSPLKVVEVFTMLNAMSGHRIDLGIGRAPGGGPLESFALRRDRHDGRTPDDFPDQLVELFAYLDGSFEADHPFRRIRMSSDTPSGAVVWLLGSSMWSSQAAAQLGLPYAFAHFFSGDDTRAAIERYRRGFKPSRHHAKPEVAIGVSVICAPTTEEAEFLASTVRLMRLRLRTGREMGPIVPPDAALRELATLPAVPSMQTEFPALVVGDPDTVHEQLTRMTTELALDEIFAVTMTHDPAMRLRSYTLLAERAGLEPRSASG